MLMSFLFAQHQSVLRHTKLVWAGSWHHESVLTQIQLQVLFCHQGFKCSPCQVQKGTTCSGQASSLRLTSSSVVQV